MKARWRIAIAVGALFACVGGWLLSRWALVAFHCAGDIKHLPPCVVAGLDIKPLLGIGLFWLPMLAILLLVVTVWVIGKAIEANLTK